MSYYIVEEIGGDKQRVLTFGEGEGDFYYLPFQSSEYRKNHSDVMYELSLSWDITRKLIDGYLDNGIDVEFFMNNLYKVFFLEHRNRNVKTVLPLEDDTDDESENAYLFLEDYK